MIAYKKFYSRSRYEVVSPLNPFVVWGFTVVSRTADRVTIQADSGEIRTLPVHVWIKSDLHPFELVIFKVGSKTVRLCSNNPTGSNWTLTGSKFTL